MDGFTNSKIEKQTIYEIYRACRLCGAGAGYKMPIIQNVVNLDNGEVELKHKVRECVQIEVHQDDKMPPLICELCVDKVNDFYEFLEMCRQTNKQTRLRLGLPPQTLPRGAPDAGDCILGVTEPIFIDHDDEPSNRSRSKTVKTKKESENRDSKNKVPPKKEVRKEERVESRALRKKAPSPSPSPPSTPRLLRGNRSHEDNMSLGRMQLMEKLGSRALRRKAPNLSPAGEYRTPSPSPPSSPRPLRGDRWSLGDQVSLSRMQEGGARRRAASRSPSPARSLRGKRQQDHDLSLSRLQKPRKSDEPTPKSILKSRDSKSEDSSKLKRLREKENEKLVNSCKKVKIVVEDITSPPKEPNPKHRCKLCSAVFDKPLALSNHLRTHNKNRPKVECKDCNKTFVHKNLLDIHRCTGKTAVSKPIKQEPQVEKTEKKTKLTKQEPQARKPEKKPAPKPENKPAPKPTRVDTPKRKPTSSKPFVIDPEHKKLLKPLQVRIAKCDPLLENKIGDHYDVTDVDYDYGTDKTCVYPYIYTFRHLRIKSEPTYMVKIQDEIKSAFDSKQTYVHWDSDETDSSDTDLTDSKKVNSLTSLSLKTLFSPKVIGKVPKKRRKAKVERAFDSILNSTNDFDTDMRLGIDNIINSLGDDKDVSKDKDDNDSLFGDAPTSPAITNSDFDTLFSLNANDSDVPKTNTNKTSTGDVISDNKSEDSNVTNLSMDFDDKVDAIDKNKGNDSIEDNNTSLEHKDSSKDDKQDKSDVDKNECTDTKNTEDEETKNDVTGNEKQNGDDNSKENLDKEKDIDDNTNAKDEKVKDSHTESDKTRVNGQTELAQEFNVDDLEDISDSEMEDSKAMEADSQIDGKEKMLAKTDASERDGKVAATEDLQVPASVKSSDLESISDGEFP